MLKLLRTLRQSSDPRRVFTTKLIALAPDALVTDGAAVGVAAEVLQRLPRPALLSAGMSCSGMRFKVVCCNDPIEFQVLTSVPELFALALAPIEC